MSIHPETPLTLPCGARLPNRLMKSAMSEALGTRTGAPTSGLETLYRRWADGGIGLSVTGNVMVDARALGEAGNVVIEDERHLPGLEAWAQAGTAHGTALWMQLNHPGKQVPKGLNRESVAPSPVPFAPPLDRFFATPRELSNEEIEDIVARFGTAARVAKRAGFSGVQIHGAHGYLVSQFLSPHHNQRDDRWGGDPERRMAFALAVYQRIRAEVGPSFPVGIKLNSADFQRGGFTAEESLAVVAALGDAGVDLIEISGGTYEAPAMAGVGQAPQKASTRAREAYFLAFAERARAVTGAPLAVTGGFRTRDGIEAALASGALDVVGLARPLALDPDLPRKLLAGEPVTSDVKPIRTGIGFVDRVAMMEVAWYAEQLSRMAHGREPKVDRNPLVSLLCTLRRQGFGTARQRLRA